MNINHSLRAKKLNEYRSGKRPQVRAIVLHDTAGAGSVNDAKYLADDPEHRGVSVDFVVLRDGTIYQLNPDLTAHSTNHAGRHTRLKVPGTNEVYENANVNAHTIGIEISHEVYAGTPKAKQSPEWPKDQIAAVAQLCYDLCDKFDLKRENITTHSKIITDGSRSDPRNFPWETFWTHSGFERTSGEDPAGHVQTFHTVVAGDTLWGLANRYKTTIEAIKALNHFDSPSTLITVGQRLLVRE